MVIFYNKGTKLHEPFREVLSLRGFNRMVETYCTPVQRDVIKAVQRHGSLSGAAYEFGWYHGVVRWHFVRGLHKLKIVSKQRIYHPQKVEEIIVEDRPVKEAKKRIRPLYIAKPQKEPEIDFAAMADRLNHRLAIAHARIMEVSSLAS